MQLLYVVFCLLLVFLVVYVVRKLLYAHLFNLCASLYNRRMGARKKRLFEGLNQVKAKRGDGRLVILDLGCGPGANFEFFPPGSEVICVDPNRHYESIVRNNVSEFPDVRVSQFHVGVAENLRDLVESDSVDVVVVTVVLCSVNDVVRSLQEIIRVLKPGGKMFFIEHVYAKGGVLRHAQWIFRRLWFSLFEGCDLCRETGLHIHAAGFQNVEMEDFDAAELTQPISVMPGIGLVRPHISGTATK